jgi:S1-C subfamily serine protease
VAVDGKPISNNADLFLALEKHQAGEKAELTLQRADGQVKVEVELVLNIVN